ncbi:MAG: hypothetical protein ACYDHP_01530 [Ferrimicrobium sp.]
MSAIDDTLDDNDTEHADRDKLRELQEQLLAAEPATMIANHAYGLFELASLYLGATPPRLEPATLAIDALTGLLDGVPDRLGEAEAPLAEGLRQLKLAYVTVAKVGK